MSATRTLKKYHAALTACKAAKDKVIEVTREYTKSDDPNKAAIKQKISP